MSIGYRIVERFDPTWQATWPKYVEWSKLTHVTEVVGLDCCLCPAVVGSDSAEDWEHVRYPEYLPAVFDDLLYALAKVPKERDLRSVQVLAVLREPTLEQMRKLAPTGFEFIGFDLIEELTCISAINNCGGFDDVFAPEDLNERGLVSELSAAQDVRQRLREAHPNEPHADCALWVVWRRMSAELDTGEVGFAADPRAAGRANTT